MRRFRTPHVRPLPKLYDEPPKEGFRGNPIAYVDLETTGLDARTHEIIEVSVLLPEDYMRLEDPVVLPEWRCYTAKMMPEHLNTADEEALKISHYEESTWKLQARDREGVAERLTELLCDQSVTIAGHNIHMDLRFLHEFFREFSVDFRQKYTIDTATLIWHRLAPLGFEGSSLVDACRICNIDTVNAHTAQGDVLMTKALVDYLSSSAFLLDRPMIKARIAELEAIRQADAQVDALYGGTK
jgi:DNA polymerase III epsilon subunit-like protein